MRKNNVVHLLACLFAQTAGSADKRNTSEDTCRFNRFGKVTTN